MTTRHPDLALAAAAEAVEAAARLCRAVSRESVSQGASSPGASTKADRSPVTVADFGSQALISHHLAQAFPDIPLVAEEDADFLRTTDGAAIRDRVVSHVRQQASGLSESGVLAAIDRGGHPGGAAWTQWVLDPIDGTKGFLRGDQYAVALALIEDGALVLGVLGCPNLPIEAAAPEGPSGCLLTAARGGGSRIRALEGGEANPILVTNVEDPAEASFCESVESGHTSHGHAEQIAARLRVEAPPYRIDSQCKYAAIARGDASIYLRLPTRKDYEEKIWDHAAGALIVEEAGGRVTDVRGQPLDFSIGRTLKNNSGVVATNGLLHDRVIAAVRAVLDGG